MLSGWTYISNLLDVFEEDEDCKNGIWKDIKEREFKNLDTYGLLPDAPLWK